MAFTPNVSGKGEVLLGKQTVLGLLFIFLFSLPALATNPVPFLTLPVVPGAVPPGRAQFTLTVNGTGFVAGSVVNWNGSALITTYVNQGQLTAVVPAANIALPGTASITVTSPPPGGGTSNIAFLPVTNPISPTFPSVPSTTLPAAPNFSVDLNGDGKLDLVTNSGVYLGNGDGTFQSVLSYPGGFTGAVILAADFNGDGIPDLVTSSGVMLGNGNGTFQTPLPFPSGVNSGAFLAGDFNRDGKLDLAYALYEQEIPNVAFVQVVVVPGNGDGTFAAPLASGNAAATSPVPVQALGDFNGDGNLDLAIAFFYQASNGVMGICLGGGDGTFQVPTASIDAPGNPNSMVAADFDGDGKLDIAIGGGAPGYAEGINFFRGDGAGSFQPEVLTVAYPMLNIAAADFNGDGALDFVANSGPYTPFVLVAINNGRGGFSALPTTYDTGFVAAGDFNGDGRIDFTAGNQLYLQSPVVSTLSTYSLAFGDQLVGTSSTSQPVRLQNSGSALLTFSSIQASANFTETDNCQPSLVAGASCTINVTFSPTATGALTGTLTINGNIPSLSPVELSGASVLPTPEISSSSLTFSSQLVGTTSPSQSVTVTNTGTLALSISSQSISPGWKQTNNCLPSVAPNASCTIKVSFQPTSSGPLTGALTITDNSASSPQMVTLSGTGIAPAVSLSASSLTFGSQVVSFPSDSESLTITNSGTGALTSLKFTVSGDFAETDNCTTPIAVDAHCTVNVTFTPTASGTRTGTLTLTDNAPGSPQTIPLSGGGMDFSIVASATSASVTPGQPATYALTVKPLGGLNQPVNLACSGAPSLSTCTVIPNTATLNGSASAPVTVSVSTTAGSMAAPFGKVLPPRTTGFGRLLWLYALLTLAGLIAVAATGRRRAAYVLALALGLMLLGSACGGGSTAIVSPTPGTPSGTYTLVVNATVTSAATSNKLTHNLNLTLNVN